MVSNKKQDLQSLGVGPTYSELHSKSISKLEYTLGSRYNHETAEESGTPADFIAAQN